MRARRPLKIAGWSLAGLLAVVLGALAVVWVAANTQAGRAWIADTLAAQLGTPEAPATVEGLHGPLPQRARLDRLVLRDAEGAWLTVEGAELRWQPLALLTGRLQIDAVAAERVELARLPAAADAAAEEPPAPDAPTFEIPSIPVAVQLQDLSVARLELGQPVLGTAAVFRIAGQAAAPEDRTLRSELTVTRLDGPQGRFAAEATYDRAQRTLELSAELDAARDGLVAKLLDLPQAGPSTVRLRGSGPIEAWTGRLEGRFGERARIDADLRLLDAARLEATGEAELGGILDEQTMRLLGGPLTFDLAVARQGESGVRVDGSTLGTPTAEVELAGGLSGDGTSVDARVGLRVLDPAPFNALAQPAGFEDLTATLRAEGPIAAPTLALEARLARLQAPDAELHDVTVQADYAPQDGLTVGRVTAAVEAGRAELAMPELAGYSGQPLDLRVDGRLDLDAMRLDQTRVDLATPGLELALDGGANLETGAGDAAFDLRLAELGKLDPVLQLGLTGQGTLTGHARVGGDGPLVAATVAGDLRDIGIGEPILQALLQDRLELATDLTVASDGALALESLNLKTPAMQVDGSLSFPADFATLAGDLRAAIPQTEGLGAALGVELAGAANADVRLTGPTDDPGVAGTIELADAAVAGQSLGRLTVEADTRTLASGAQGALDAQATASPVGELTAATDFALGADAFTLSGLRADAANLTVRDGRLAVSLAGDALTGEVNVRSDDLGGPLQRLAGLQAAGTADLSLTLGDSPQGQGVGLEGTISGLNLADGAATMETVRIRADLQQAFDAPSGQMRVTLEQAASGPARFRTLSLTADGGLGGLAVKLRGEGELLGPMQLAADANLDVQGPAQTVRLSRFQLDIGERRLRLTREAVLRQDPEMLSVRDLILEIGDGRIVLDGRRGPKRVELALDVSNLPLSYSGLVLEQPQLSGRMDATARLQGPIDAPTGSLNVNLKEVASTGTDLPPLDAWLNSTLRDGAYTASGQISGLAETPVQLSARLPVALSLAPFATGLRDDADIEGKITWAGEVAPLMALVPVGGHRLTGQADVAFEVGGQLDDPQVDGRLTLDGATYENLDTGTLLTDLALTVEGTGERIEITRFQAKDGGNGSLSLAGGVDIAPEEGFPIELQVDATNARLVRLDYLVANTDLDLEITGSLQDMLLAGTVRVRRAEARMPETLPPEVAELNVVTEQELEARRAAAESGRAPQPQASEPSRLALDITVEMPNQVFVRGNGLDSEWGGRLQVTGTAAQPVVRGDIVLQRGTLSFLGQTFALDSGTVSFDGGRKIDPRLDITAVNSTPNLTATVRVSGPASDPELTLSSTPPLPQDEVLSRLLFGKSAANLTPLEGAQLAAAVAELSLSGGGPGLLDRLRGLVGVDVLRVGSSGEGDAASPTVEAGEYVTDEVFVGVQQGATAETSKVKVEVELTDNIVLESDVGVTGRSNVGVQFRWNY